jgi:phosphatidylglycerophosphatase A
MSREKIIKIAATFFGAGEVEGMPGTIGTIAAIPLYIIIAMVQYLPMFRDENGNTSIIYYNFYFIFLALFFVFASYISGEAEKYYREKDCQKIVIDEVLGFLTTMFLIKFHIVTIILGFIFFRIFDIIKIYPINKAQEVEGGVGVVLDDFIAGIFANIMVVLLSIALNI